MKIRLANKALANRVPLCMTCMLRVLTVGVVVGGGLSWLLTMHIHSHQSTVSPINLFFLLFSSSLFLSLCCGITAAVFWQRLAARRLRYVSNYLDATPNLTLAEPLDVELFNSKEFLNLANKINQVRETLIRYQNNMAQEQRRYMAFVDSNPEAIWCCECKTPIDIRLPEYEQTQGLIDQCFLVISNTPAKLLLSEFGSSNTKASRDDFAPLFTRELAGELISKRYRLKEYETQLIDSQSQARYFQNSLICVIENQLITHIWGIAIEVTEHVLTLRELREREAQLIRSESRLGEAQSLANMGHWNYYAESDELQVSSQFSRIYGFNALREKPTWRQLIQRMHTEDRTMVINLLSDPKSESVGTEHRIVWPDGQLRYVKAVAKKVVKNNQVISSFGILMDITKQRQAEIQRRKSEQALIESEARMAEAQAISHMGHWVLDYDSRELICSDEFFRLHGFVPQSFKPHVSHFIKQIHPDDLSRVQAKLDKAKDEAFTEEYRILRIDGEERYMRATVTPYYSPQKQVNRIFGISIDITEQKKAEMELQASQERFTKAFQASPDGIFIIQTNNMKLVDANSSFFDLIGLTAESANAFSLKTINMFNEEQQPVDLERLLTQYPPASNLEVHFKNLNQQDTTVLLSCRTVELNGRSSVLGNMRDITSVRRLEQQAARQQKQLLQADKLASLGTMVAGVAHEINNPNHLIQMNAELLEGFSHRLIDMLEENLSDAQKAQDINGLGFQELSETFPELLEDIRHSSKRIASIVKGLKDFSRPQENSEYLPTNLNDVIKKTMHLLTSVLDRRSSQLEFVMEEELPLVQADSQRLQQVLINLIMNALEASANNQGHVLVKTRYDAINETVICSVADEGCGIPEEILSQIFDPFFTTKQNSGGTGLGLAISFSIVREHGGHLEATRNEEGTEKKGTTLQFSLPALAKSDPIENPIADQERQKLQGFQ